MKRAISYSLSLRLLAIFGVAALLSVLGVLAGIRWVYRADDLRSLVSGHLSLHVDYVRKDIGDPPRIERALAITRSVPVDIRIDGPGLSWSSDARFPDPATLAFGPSDYFSERPGSLVDRLEGVDFATRANHNFLRFHEGDYQIVVSTPKIATHRGRPDLIPILLGFAVLLVLGTYLAVRWLFAPLESIREGAAYIGAGHFQHRIAAPRDDELGALAADINSMAGNVQAMLDGKRQLLLGMSHELRSPLSRARLQLELLEESPAVAALRRDVATMADIIETLLQAERLGSAHSALDRRPTDLAALAAELQARFHAGEPRLRIDAEGAPRASVDGARILLMLKNLVDNALRHALPNNGAVELSIRTTGSHVEFRVRDQGPGVPESMRAHLFEPFFRPDPARSPGSGGAGLGLYLARQVARAHGGDLVLAQDDGPGALFVASIPLNEGTSRL